MLPLLCFFLLFQLVFTHPNKNTYSPQILRALALQNNLTIHEECSYASGDCFLVKDFVSYFGGQLITPSPITSKNILIRNWEIDKTTIDSGFPYAELFIAIGYVTEALSYDSREKQQVLLIGLGGGVMSNFLSTIPNIETTAVELDPAIVKVAVRYFSHHDVKGVLQTLTADGVRVLERTVQQDQKYRVIMIDAAYNGDTTGTGLIAPVRPFLKSQVIQNIFNSLEEGGTVAVNVISISKREEREEETLQIYKQFFPACYFIPFLTVRNKLLVCSKRLHWTLDEQKELFRRNMKTAIRRLRFKELEYEIDF